MVRNKKVMDRKRYHISFKNIANDFSIDGCLTHQQKIQSMYSKPCLWSEKDFISFPFQSGNVLSRYSHFI